LKAINISFRPNTTRRLGKSPPPKKEQRQLEKEDERQERGTPRLYKTKDPPADKPGKDIRLPPGSL
jgi:hypothetical protein